MAKWSRTTSAKGACAGSAPCANPQVTAKSQKERRESHRTIVLLPVRDGRRPLPSANWVRSGRKTAKMAATLTADAMAGRRFSFHLSRVRTVRVRNSPMPEWDGFRSLGHARSLRRANLCLFPDSAKATIFPEIGRDLWLPSRALGLIDRRVPETLEGLADCMRDQTP